MLVEARFLIKTHSLKHWIKALLGGAGLDVTTPEPLPKDSKLWQMENVYITPHNAPSSPYMVSRLMTFIEDNIDRYIQNKELKNKVSL